VENEENAEEPEGAEVSQRVARGDVNLPKYVTARFTEVVARFC
jgi:hypothetical protein